MAAQFPSIDGPAASARGCRWSCAGLPMLAARPLAAAEVKALERSVTSMNVLAVAGLLCAIAAPLGFHYGILAKAAADGPRPHSLSETAVIMLLFCATLFGGPLGLVAAGAGWYQRRGFRRDLSSGVVLTFAGVAGHSEDPGFLVLVAQRFVTLGQPVELEVLAGSGRVLFVNKRSLIIGAPRLELTAVAAVPPSAAVAGNWLRPLPGPDEANVTWGRRLLSDSEREELGRFNGKTWRAIATGGVLAAMSLVAFALFSTPGWAPYISYPARALFGVAFLATARLQWSHGRSIHLARRDIAAGEVFIFAESTEPGGATPHRVEVLPHSHRMWTQAGEPAPWRSTSRGELG